jgi:hypothetical protein
MMPLDHKGLWLVGLPSTEQFVMEFLEVLLMFCQGVQFLLVKLKNVSGFLACQDRNVASYNAGFFSGSDVLVEVDQKSPDEDPCRRMPRSCST